MVCQNPQSAYARFRIPLSCVVDYAGVRLIAIAMLPIDANTLVYGVPPSLEP